MYSCVFFVSDHWTAVCGMHFGHVQDNSDILELSFSLHDIGGPKFLYRAHLYFTAVETWSLTTPRAVPAAHAWLALQWRNHSTYRCLKCLPAGQTTHLSGSFICTLFAHRDMDELKVYLA